MERGSPIARRLPWRIVLAVALLVALLLAAALGLALTSATPLGRDPAAPSAQEVGAGRDAFLQLRAGRGAGQGVAVRFGPAQLAGIGALASNGFAPDRLRIAVRAGRLDLAASHRLPGGRWLNVQIRARGSGRGFPPIELRVGRVTLPPTLARRTIEAARSLLRLRGIAVPPLDRLIQSYAIGSDDLAALILLPPKAGLIDDMAWVAAGATAPAPDTALVVRLYCALVAAQAAQPIGDFAGQVRRAFSLPGRDRAPQAYNRAAFIALAMLIVDPRAGDLAGAAASESASCRIAPVVTQMYGRSDWPKHWALSAALAAGAGVRLAEAMGAWKELADSLERRSRFAIGDPSGFSFADLAADRAGFRIADRAVTAEDAARLGRRLGAASPERLLPRALTLSDDGLSDAAFRRRYGSLADPRFQARIREIDRAIDRAGLIAPG